MNKSNCPCGRNQFVKVNQEDIKCIRCSSCGFVAEVFINSETEMRILNNVSKRQNDTRAEARCR